jgi:hypothetical protein
MWRAITSAPRSAQPATCTAVANVSSRPAPERLDARLAPRLVDRSDKKPLLAKGPLPKVSRAEALRFLEEVVVPKENVFFAKAVGPAGVTYDALYFDPKTGALTEDKHVHSAASKESLHLALAVKALGGDRLAQKLLSPDPGSPAAAIPHLLRVLEKKIATYERFDADYPGYGGFLPWFRTVGDHIEPQPDWTDRVPLLDNGQLMWSLLAAASTLEQKGHDALAARYRSYLDKLAKNVVPMFFDPRSGQLAAEASIARGNKVPPEENRYTNERPHYVLDDPYEGWLAVLFADLYGDWSGQAAGDKERPWSTPRHHPVKFTARDGRSVVALRGAWFSAHERWGHMMAPINDHPTAGRVFHNTEAVAAMVAAEDGEPGLAATAYMPTPGSGAPEYRARGISREGLTLSHDTYEKFFPVYSLFTMALTKEAETFHQWLRTMLDAPGMISEGGMAESFDLDGNIAPILTWDGKATLWLAMTGGIIDETREVLKREGRYDALIARIGSSYSAFSKEPSLDPNAPWVAIPEPSVHFVASRHGFTGRPLKPWAARARAFGALG